MKEYRAQIEIYNDITLAMSMQCKVGYSVLNESMMPNGKIQLISDFCEYIGNIAASKIPEAIQDSDTLKEKVRDVAKKSIRSPHHTDEETQILLVFALDLDELA